MQFRAAETRAAGIPHRPQPHSTAAIVNTAAMAMLLAGCVFAIVAA
jgi:hypothetical protein